MKSKRKIKNKRAQAFLLDIIVGILFFTTALMFYFKYSQNINTQNQEYELMMLDANYISNNLLSDGSPNNWEEIPLENLSKEIIFGITNNNYSLVKQSFETPYDFYIIIEKKDSNITFGKNYANAKTLVKTTRFLFYNGSIIKMHLYVFY